MHFTQAVLNHVSCTSLFGWVIINLNKWNFSAFNNKVKSEEKPWKNARFVLEIFIFSSNLTTFTPLHLSGWKLRIYTSCKQFGLNCSFCPTQRNMEVTWRRDWPWRSAGRSGSWTVCSTASVTDLCGCLPGRAPPPGDLGCDAGTASPPWAAAARAWQS